MEQHAVPQNIASYEFKLVGDMTLKQFLELAGGVIVGLVFWSLPLPLVVRSILVFLSCLFGVLMAFVPINGRPFGQWVLAFFRAVYSPTQYYWKAPSSPTAPLAPNAVPSPPKGEVKPASPLDHAESQAISRITTLFNPPLTAEVARQATLPPLPTPTKTTPSKPIQVTAPPPPPTSPLFSSLTPLARHSPPSGGGGATPAPPALSMPPPTQPNILIGAVVDTSGNSIDGVIIEISDSSTGIPVRALRTNRLGQFQIATPLLSGKYLIQAEKDGLTFFPVSIIAAGKIIPPILIKSNSQ